MQEYSILAATLCTRISAPTLRETVRLYVSLKCSQTNAISHFSQCRSSSEGAMHHELEQLSVFCTHVSSQVVDLDGVTTKPQNGL